MNIYILIAHYPSSQEPHESEHIFASTSEALFEETVKQLNHLMVAQPSGYLAQMCGIANHHFQRCPERLETISLQRLTAPLPLSRREREIAEEITKGTAPAEIARILSLSVKTVSTYRARILEKLQLGSNAEIAMRMRDYGLA